MSASIDPHYISLSNSNSDLKKSPTDLRQQYIAMSSRRELDDDALPASGNNLKSVNAYGSSTSTLGTSSTGHQIPKSEMSKRQGQNLGIRNGFTDFFSSEVFQIVLHNPTTAHRFLKFCQNRACSENIEFLQKIDSYNRLLDEITKVLSEIQTNYTAVEAPRQINISYPLIKRINSDIKTATQSTIPALESIFAGSQEHVEKLLASDTYPRFVKHQVTTSATVALADDKSRFQGLGDCFCLTDPSVADNPIVFASDGFVEVTGYSRRDIVPRNCRFLQGPLTDQLSVRRLRASIDNAEETVELLLNYRKNGDPFWNLLYISPLFDESGNIKFFLGGQINCSTTIHSCTDILKILSLNDEGLIDRGGDMESYRPPSSRPDSKAPSVRTRSSFFKSFKAQKPTVKKMAVRSETGMEGELIDKIGKMDFRTQVEAFYTAYSKYLVLKYSPVLGSLTITYFSPGVIDLLCLNLPNGGIVPIFGKDIFKILSEHSQSSSTHKALKNTVKEFLRKGNAVSVELGLMTGMESRRGGFTGMSERRGGRAEEKYVSHWTPLKDEEGRANWVVLTIAPK